MQMLHNCYASNSFVKNSKKKKQNDTVKYGWVILNKKQ